MDKRLATFFSVLIIVVFIGYMVFDTVRPDGLVKNTVAGTADKAIPDLWEISGELEIKSGDLKAVSVSSEGRIFAGGDSFIQCFDNELNLVWSLDTPYPVTSLAVSGDTIFAATMELILLVTPGGVIMEEWGPFEYNAIFTSIAANSLYVAVADAGNKMVFILDKKGVVKSLIGQSGESFIIPSPYFDVALDSDDSLYVANTGHRRVEVRNFEGNIERFFGEPGTAPEAFCGCCNPAHFIAIPQGFATAEKGINRIKIINEDGDFVEYVSSKNRFTASIPLDLASSDGKTIYAANPSDSKLYIFTRK